MFCGISDSDGSSSSQAASITATSGPTVTFCAISGLPDGDHRFYWRGTAGPEMSQISFDFLRIASPTAPMTTPTGSSTSQSQPPDSTTSLSPSPSSPSMPASTTTFITHRSQHTVNELGAPSSATSSTRSSTSSSSQTGATSPLPSSFEPSPAIISPTVPVGSSTDLAQASGLLQTPATSADTTKSVRSTGFQVGVSVGVIIPTVILALFLFRTLRSKRRQKQSTDSTCARTSCNVLPFRVCS